MRPLAALLLLLPAVRAAAGEEAEAWLLLPPGQGAPPELDRSELGVEGARRDARGRWLRLHGPAPLLRELEARGYALEWLPAGPRPLPAGYRSPEELREALEALAEAWPEEARLLLLGYSREGRPIEGLVVGSGGRRLRVLGTHHGDERSSGELVLAAAEALLEQGPPEGVELCLVPQVNPDGAARGSRYDAAEVDLNRNYDYQWSAQEYRSGSGPFSEPETRAVRVLSVYQGFGLGLSYHAGATNIGYVWNYTTEPAPDDALARELAERYAADCPQEGFYVTNGAAWYVTHGDTNDWSYGRTGALDFTVELSQQKEPPLARLQSVIEQHLPALRAFAEAVPALEGRAVDAETGLPVQVVLEPEGGWPTWSGPDGRFARWLAGPARVELWAPGYEPVEIEASPGEGRELELELEASALLDPAPSSVLLSWGDEPVELELDLPDGPVTLWRPGYPELEARSEGGVLELVPAELAPGPWGLLLGDGRALPNLLFVGERDQRAGIEAVDWDRDLVVRGWGFGPGSRAWAIGGRGRWAVELPLLDETGESLRFDPTPASALPSPVDLLVLSAGAQLAALDARGEPRLDTGTAAPGDTGPLPLPPGGGACGCTPGGGPAGWPAGLLALLGLLRRRSTQGR